MVNGQKEICPRKNEDIIITEFETQMHHTISVKRLD